MRNRDIIFSAVVIFLAMVSCEHKELCYTHDEHAPQSEFVLTLSFDCEWEYNTEDNIKWKQNWKEDYGISYEELRPQEPSGVRVHVFNEDDQTETIRNLTKDNSTIRFSEEGHYDLLFYNNDTEYIVFEGLESFGSAHATTRASGRSSAVNPPDMLFGAFFNSLLVERKPEPDTLTVTLKPLVYKYLLRFEASEGVELIEKAGGFITGLATGVNLYDGSTSSGEGMLAFECDMKGNYGTQGIIQTFGIPDYPNPNYLKNSGDRQRKHELYLEIVKTNGKIQTFKYDVTDQMLSQPHGGVILVQNIKIEENTSGGAFDVGVTGWGDYIDVPLN